MYVIYHVRSTKQTKVISVLNLSSNYDDFFGCIRNDSLELASDVDGLCQQLFVKPSPPVVSRTLEGSSSIQRSLAFSSESKKPRSVSFAGGQNPGEV